MSVSVHLTVTVVVGRRCRYELDCKMCVLTNYITTYNDTITLYHCM